MTVGDFNDEEARSLAELIDARLMNDDPYDADDLVGIVIAENWKSSTDIRHELAKTNIDNLNKIGTLSSAVSEQEEIIKKLKAELDEALKKITKSPANGGYTLKNIKISPSSITNTYDPKNWNFNTSYNYSRGDKWPVLGWLMRDSLN